MLPAIEPRFFSKSSLDILPFLEPLLLGVKLLASGTKAVSSERDEVGGSHLGGSSEGGGVAGFAVEF